MTRIDNLISELCSEIDDLESQLKKAKQEAIDWRTKYNSLLDNDIKHSQEMILQTIDLLMTPGVTTAIVENSNKNIIN